VIVALDWQPYAVLAGLLLITFSLVMRLRKRVRAAAERPARSRDRRPGGDEENPLRRSMEQLLVELQGLSRQINAQLDTKMRALTQLTDEARREIERLERLLEEAQAGLPRAEASAPAPAAEPGPAPPDPRPRRVYELADAGLGAVEIARQTGQPVGEVELILSLRSAGAPRDGDSGDRDVRGGQIDLRT
jgi:hypothetical protein